MSVLVKVPVPPASVVLLSLIVGLALVLQHIPRTVTGEPPSLVIDPPPCAPVEEIELMAVVLTVASPTSVVKLFSLPYEVPTLLVT